MYVCMYVCMFIWGFWMRQHLRSLAPVMNDYGWLWWPNDIRGPWGLKLPDISLKAEGKPRKNLTEETCPDRGSNPGPLRDRRAYYHLAQSGGLKEIELGNRQYKVYTYTWYSVTKLNRKSSNLDWAWTRVFSLCAGALTIELLRTSTDAWQNFPPANDSGGSLVVSIKQSERSVKKLNKFDCSSFRTSKAEFPLCPPHGL